MTRPSRPEQPSAAQLALLGADPAFAMPVHVGRPNIGDPEQFFERARGIFDRRWLTNNGPLVQEFEQRIREQAGTEHAIAFCNATVALEVLVRAAGLTGSVVVPSYTFVATAHCLHWMGLRPIFADVDPRSHTLDVQSVREAVAPDTSAILAVHLWGQPCDVDGLAALASDRGLRLFYDAAHAYGCSRGGRPVGSFGDAEVFSFHATKFVNSFEGGAITTNDSELAQRCRLMRNFGFAGIDLVVSEGTNGKMSEVSAAMGLTSLDAMDSIIAHNRRNHEAYGRALADIRGMSLFSFSTDDRANYQYVIATVDADACALDRDELVNVLEAENVLARRYFTPGCHRMEPYRRLVPDAGKKLPVTEQLCRSVLALPTGTAVSVEDVERISGILRTATSAPEEVRRALSDRAAAR